MLQKNKQYAFWQVLSLLFYFSLSTQILRAEKNPFTASFLLPNGTLNMYRIGNQEFSLDLKGWDIRLDPRMGPVFSPAPVPVPNTWNALSQGLNNQVFAIAVNGSDVYVGGIFTGVGGGIAVAGLNNIAKWNGAAWSALGQGLNGAVYDITVNSSAIYVGGGFTAVGGGTAVAGLNRIAKWDGTAWSALGQGLNNGVGEITMSGTNLYVGGNFTDVGGGAALVGLNNIAKWDGTVWTALGQGLNQSVNAIAIAGSDIYVGGNFTNVGGGSAVAGLNYIAKWNGTAWSPLNQGLNNTVNALLRIGTDVYAGGWFTGVGGGTEVAGLSRIAKWNGSAWSALGQGLSGTVFALTPVGSDIYVGGQFEDVGGGTSVAGLKKIGKWNGTQWSALDMGLNGDVFDVALGSSDIYGGGNFTNVGGGIAIAGLNNIARWELTPTNPIVYIVTGGGSYCAGGAGIPVGLSNSEIGASYQLKRDNTNVGSSVPGTGAALNFGNQTIAGTYTVEATKGSTTITMSGSAIIIVAPTTSIISGIVPATSTLCVGAVQILNASANGSNLVAEWQRKAAGASSFTFLFNANLGGSNAAAYTLPPATLADNGASYRVIFKGGCGNATAADAVLTVTNMTAPQVGISPLSQRVCLFNNFSLSLSGTTAPSVLNWQIGLILANQQVIWSDIINSAGKTTYTSIAPVKTSKFRAVINSSCGKTYSAEATVEACGISPFGYAQAAIYPNPVSSVLNIILNNDANEMAYITISDLTGRVLIHDIWSLDKGENQKSFETQALTPSVYVLRLNTEGGQRQILKFIKQ